MSLTSVSFTEISGKFRLLADGQGVGIVFRHWIHFLNYLNKKTFKKDSWTMLRFLPCLPWRLLVKCSLLWMLMQGWVRWGRAGPEQPLNINLALTNTLSGNHYRIWPSHPHTADCTFLVSFSFFSSVFISTEDYCKNPQQIKKCRYVSIFCLAG